MMMFVNMRFPALQADDFATAGAVDWLRSPTRRRVTAVIGVVVAAAWSMAVVCSIASWRSDAVAVAAIVIVRLAAFTMLPAGLWLAGNAFRLFGLQPRLGWYNPLSRPNLAMNLLLVGLVRPTRRSVMCVAAVLVVAAAVMAANAHAGIADIDSRTHASVDQISEDGGYTWVDVSHSAYVVARAENLRSATTFALVGDSVMVLAMIGFYRLDVADDRSAPAGHRTPGGIRR